MKGWKTLGAVLRLVLIVLVAGSLPFLMRGLVPPSLPTSLGPATLTRSIEGAQARSVIEGMHDRDVGRGANSIGFYRSDSGSATLYVTFFTSGRAAKEAERAMTLRISRGTPVFDGFRPMRFRDKAVGLCYGLGQMHFFFAEGRRVYWLASDPAIAAETAHGLLQSAIR